MISRKTGIIIGVVLLVLIIGGILIYPFLPFYLDFREFQEGYKLENAFPKLSFENPTDLQNPDDGSNRLFLVQQSGEIYVFKNNKDTADKTLFLDISSRVIFNGEMGLLGLTFHPKFEDNGYFFIDYVTDDPRRTQIVRGQVSDDNPNRANKSSLEVLLEVEQPYGNHNAGGLAFGPDGYLYLTFGDGGAAGDPQENGQDTSTLLGSILRIDVDKQEGGRKYAIPNDNPFVNDSSSRDEIFAYGLRNPWRISFDNKTGKLWTGDVGQNSWEEVDIIEKGGNYGWNAMEGMHCYEDNCDPDKYILPVAEYGRDQGKSITGGYVYRGDNEPGLQGKYIFGDYLSGRIWSLNATNASNAEKNNFMKYNILISTFGVDESGELYVVDRDDGIIYDIVSI